MNKIQAHRRRNIYSWGNPLEVLAHLKRHDTRNTSSSRSRSSLGVEHRGEEATDEERT